MRTTTHTYNNRQQTRRALAWWIDRESEEEDYRPRLAQLLTEPPLSDYKALTDED